VPAGMDFDPAGNLYIADQLNNAIRMIDLDGNVTTIAGGKEQGFVDGKVIDAKFFGPMGLVFFENSLYVTDTMNHKIRAIDLGNKIVSTLCGSDEGHVDGKSIKAKFSHPTGITVDDIGCLYVTEASENVHRVRCILILTGHVSTPAGSEVSGFNKTDVKGSKARFNYPIGICFHNGVIYLCDKRNCSIRCIKVTKTGKKINEPKKRETLVALPTPPETTDSTPPDFPPPPVPDKKKFKEKTLKDSKEEPKEEKTLKDSKEEKKDDKKVDKKDTEKTKKVEKELDKSNKVKKVTEEEISSEDDFEAKIQKSEILQAVTEENNTLREEIEELKRIIKTLPSREEFDILKQEVKKFKEK
jgi:hypothetical protein